MHRLRRLIAVTAALAPLLGLAQPASALPLKLFPLPYPENCARPSFVFGPNDSLWFGLGDCVEHLDVESYWSAIGRLPLDDPRPQIVRRLKQAPSNLTVGPEGNLWFTEGTFPDAPAGEVPHIGRLTVSGQLTLFPTPVHPGLRYTLHEQAGQILPGPENDLWFVAEGLGANVLARITPSGVSSLFPAQQIMNGRHELEAKADEVPRALATAADGNLWMGEQFEAGTVGLVEAGGVIKQIHIGESDQGVLHSADDPMVGTPTGACGSWKRQDFTQIGPEGAVLSRIPTGSGREGFTGSVAATGDDVLWVAMREEGEVLERVTSTGELGKLTFCSSNEAPEQMIVGPEGDLWFIPQTGKASAGSPFRNSRANSKANECRRGYAARKLPPDTAGQAGVREPECGGLVAVTRRRSRLPAILPGYSASDALSRRRATRVLVLRVPLRPAVRALLRRRGRLRLRLTLRSGAHVAASRLVVLRG